MREGYRPQGGYEVNYEVNKDQVKLASDDRCVPEVPGRAESHVAEHLTLQQGWWQ